MNLGFQFVYLGAAFLFIFGLKLLGKPETARNGNLLSAFGMLLAIIVTLLSQQIVSYRWILIGLIIGSLVGVAIARRVIMTAMPQMVALLNGFGGLASLLVATEEYHRHGSTDSFSAMAIALSVVIGGITFSGSLVAWSKLSERIPGRALLFPGQRAISVLFAMLVIGGVIGFGFRPETSHPMLIGLIVGALGLGVLTVIPIGGADMPVVISLLNSYSGLAACATGFVLRNNLLIVTGSLVGASGIILTRIMCKAMNRSLINVFFGGFGAIATRAAKKNDGEVKSINVEDAYVVLEAARSVVIVPGYGLAVAQAQHVLHDLADLLEANGAEVRYAIHPVAGRMPGHMNVLLAEANVSYEQLYELESINPLMKTVDVCLVVGANDVVNPAAREDRDSSLYGMPIVDADHAGAVIVLKRSMSAGFSGIENPLFRKENTRMLFGDARETLQALTAEFKS